MGFKGTLESINLADIFQNLAMNQQTGTLRVQNRNEFKCIYFERGGIRYLSRGRRQNLRLGEMLVGRGVATQEQIDRALDYQRSTGKLLGEVFVEMQIVTQDEIDALVRFQIEEEIYELFLWNQADFEFTDGPPPPDLFDEEQQTTEVSINTSGLIMEAARRLDEWENLRKIIHSTQEVYIATPEAHQMAAAGSLDPLPARIIEFCDGSRDVDDVVADSFFSRFEIEQSLCDMLSQGHLRVAGRHDLESAIDQCKASENHARVVKLYEKILSLAEGQAPEIRSELADACLAIGETDKAAIHLGILAQQAAQAGDEEQAVTLWEQVVGLSPHNLPARQNLARISAEHGRKKEAIGQYIKIIGTHMDRNQTRNVKQACRQALEIDPGHVEIRRQLIRLYMDESNKPAAIAELEILADKFQSSQNARGAAESYRQILQIDKDNLGARAALSNVQKTETEKKRQRFTSVFIWILLALFILAAGWLGANEWRQNQLLTEADRKKDELLFRYRTKRHEEKIKLYEQAIKLYEPLEKVFAPLTNVGGEASKRLAGLRITYNSLRKTKPEDIQKNADADVKELIEQAKGLMRDGHEEEAKALLDEAVAIPNASVGVLAEADTLRQNLGQKKKALQDFADWHRAIDRDQPKDDLPAITSKIHELVKDYPDDAKDYDLRLPLRITSDPAGCEVYVTIAGRPLPDDSTRTPLLIWYPLDQEVIVRAERPGYQTQDGPQRKLIARRANPDWPPTLLHFTLKRKILWTRNLLDAGAVTAGPYPMQNGRYLVLDARGQIITLDRQTGRETVGRARERYRLPLDEVTSGFHQEEDLLLFGTKKGWLYALKIQADGKLSLRFKMQVGEGAVVGTPVVHRILTQGDRKCIFVGSKNGTLACYDLQGKENWSFHVPDASFVTRVTFVKALGFVGTADGRIHAFKDATGQRVPDKSRRVGSGKLSDFLRLPSPDTHVYFVDGVGRVHYYDLISGENRTWSTGISDEAVGAPVLDANRLFFCTRKGYLHCFDVETGEPPTGWPRRGFRTDGPIRGAPALSERWVYVTSENHKLYCLDRRSAKPAWDFKTAGKITTPPLVMDGVIYFGSHDRTLYALEEIN